MKLGRISLVESLSFLSEGVNTRGIVEELGFLRWDLVKDESIPYLLLTVHDGNSTMQKKLGVESVDTEVAITAFTDFSKVYDIVKLLSVDALTVTIDTQKSKVIIQAGKSKYDFGITLGTFKFPEIPDTTTKHPFPNNFGEHLGRVEYSISEDASRPDLTVAYVNKEGLVATNNFSVNMYKEVGVTDDFFLPRNVVKTLIKSKSEHYTLILLEKKLCFVLDGNRRIVSNHLDVTFPSYKQIFEKFVPAVSMTLTTAPFADALRRVLCLARDIEEKTVTLTLFKDRAILASKSLDAASKGMEAVEIISEQFPVDLPQMLVRFDGTQLLVHLDAIASIASTIQVQLNADSSQLIINSTNQQYSLVAQF